jgi:hypothetical protein
VACERSRSLAQLTLLRTQRENQPNPSPITMKATEVNSGMAGRAAEDSFRIFAEIYRTTEVLALADIDSGNGMGVSK